MNFFHTLKCLTLNADGWNVVVYTFLLEFYKGVYTMNLTQFGRDILHLKKIMKTVIERKEHLALNWYISKLKFVL